MSQHADVDHVAHMICTNIDCFGPLSGKPYSQPDRPAANKHLAPIIGKNCMIAFLFILQSTVSFQSLSVSFCRDLGMMIWLLGGDEAVPQPATLSALTQLTALRIVFDGFTFPEFIHQTWSLPSLKELLMVLDRNGNNGNERPPADVVFKANQLSNLAVSGRGGASVSFSLLLSNIVQAAGHECQMIIS